jgi:hypothetical protein
MRLAGHYPQQQFALPAGSTAMPDSDPSDPYRRRFTPGREVVYSLPLTHSNELVTLYAAGAAGQAGGPAALFAPYLGQAYGGAAGVSGAIDNTAIYAVMRDWLSGPDGPAARP